MDSPLTKQKLAAFKYSLQILFGKKENDVSNINSFTEYRL